MGLVIFCQEMEEMEPMVWLKEGKEPMAIVCLLEMEIWWPMFWQGKKWMVETDFWF